MILVTNLFNWSDLLLGRGHNSPNLFVLHVYSILCADTKHLQLIMPPFEKGGHIALHMSVGWSVGRSVGRYVGIP